jgi:hypothetical protein
MQCAGRPRQVPLAGDDPEVSQMMVIELRHARKLGRFKKENEHFLFVEFPAAGRGVKPLHV